MEKVLWVIIVVGLSDPEGHGEDVSSDNCHCVIRYGAT